MNFDDLFLQGERLFSDEQYGVALLRFRDASLGYIDEGRIDAALHSLCYYASTLVVFEICDLAKYIFQKAGEIAELSDVCSKTRCNTWWWIGSVLGQNLNEPAIGTTWLKKATNLACSNGIDVNKLPSAFADPLISQMDMVERLKNISDNPELSKLLSELRNRLNAPT